MLIRLISLVFLFSGLNFHAIIYAENNDFIYPKNKPSIFKKLPPKPSIITPSKKPEIKKIEKLP